MATLSMEPIGTTLTSQTKEDTRVVDSKADSTPHVDDTSDIDSEWVILQQSDIGPVDLGFVPLPMIPIWAKTLFGAAAYILVPFYKRARKAEVEAVENVETAVLVVENVAEVTEKLASNVAQSLSGDGAFKQAALKIENFAEEVDKDAEKAEAIIRKIDMISNEVDAVVEPIIEKLEDEFKGKKGSKQN